MDFELCIQLLLSVCVVEWGGADRVRERDNVKEYKKAVVLRGGE